MPAVVALTIYDGASTPVLQTYAPITTNGAKAEWANRAPAMPSGWPTISHEVSPPNGSRTTYKITQGYKIPVVVNVGGVDTVTRYSSAQVVFNFHPDSTEQERKDMLAIVVNSMAEASFVTAVEDLEPHY